MSAPNATVTVGDVRFGNHLPITLIAGPCQMESRDHAFEIAGSLKQICAGLGIGLVYKSSFDKANRTSLGGKRGHRARQGACPVFADIKARTGPAGDHRRPHRGAMRHRGRGRRHPADPGLSVPPDRSADRCGQDRQGHQRQEGPVPGPMGHEERARQGHRERQCQCAADRTWRVLRLQHAGQRHAVSADHGRMGAPVVFDATHSVQQPGGQGGLRAASANLSRTLARAAVAVGVAGPVSSRPTRIPTTRRPMDPTWFRWVKCRGCSKR
jgi:2-dehydro-3-deoxyphosphooctonate aldolase (KDO 8-P synthase)